MKVKPLATVEVVPILPEAVRGLKDLACNLIWSWNPDIAALFRALDSELFDAVGHNPVRVLREISQHRLEQVAQDPNFVDHYNRCQSYLEHYFKEPGWFEKVRGHAAGTEIVYFSMEYGLAECVPVYSGGLGVLSGDHLKSASDLGLPLVGIGLAYRQGYFQQQLTADGFQVELYPENNFDELPFSPVLDKNGDRLKISLNFPGRTLVVSAWKVHVGRISLYLLDTDVAENSPADRRITYMLYGGDRETRIQQEIVLGMGGVELVTQLGIQTTVCHMNEGHSAFIQLARVARAREASTTSRPTKRFTLCLPGPFLPRTRRFPRGSTSFPPI